ncbi:MAG: DNA double-strand break repair nuclease NurA [Pyrinomonadaceae bacterium]|nr:DNA double-strand break repair nuclease NurA [Pyrinomonadaceae bacterium]
MLYRNHLVEALQDRREEFVSFERAWLGDVRDYVRRLQALGGRSAEEVHLVVGATKAPGALPSAELDERGAVRVTFEECWRSHEDARRWAIDVLRDRTTFAADGSQILPGREISLPVAAVQVASFENPHVLDGNYRKEVRFLVVPPTELLEADGVRGAETVVSLRRFEMEVEATSLFLQRKKGWRARGERMPVAFFDGTLLISYARPRTPMQDKYISRIIELVKLSRDMAVPIVGFIDQSYARDLINLLDAIDKRERQSALYDAQLLHAAVDGQPSVLAAWGERTIFCYCVREGLGSDFLEANGKPLVGFTYLQTTGDGPPARLDVPAWIDEQELLDEVTDVVRAECVVGNGYPYALETADAAAVITARDRMQFLRAMQEFAENENIAFCVSRKAASKNHRR